MIAVLQRVRKASVSINEVVKARIDKGFLVLLGICEEDDDEDVEWLSGKVGGMRVFSDDTGKMNLSLHDIGGEVLVVSQFTLHASTKKGNRPSFIQAAKPDKAIPLYEQFIRGLRDQELGVETGEFGANMQVELLNDGPVTIIVDSKNRV